MLQLWCLYAIVSVADLILTALFLDHKTEGNPIAAWVWASYGFYGVAVYKILAIKWGIFVPTTILHSKRPKLAEKVLKFGIIITSLTVIAFLPVLYFKWSAYYG